MNPRNEGNWRNGSNFRNESQNKNSVNCRSERPWRNGNDCRGEGQVRNNSGSYQNRSNNSGRNESNWRVDKESTWRNKGSSDIEDNNTIEDQHSPRVVNSRYISNDSEDFNRNNNRPCFVSNKGKPKAERIFYHSNGQSDTAPEMVQNSKTEENLFCNQNDKTDSSMGEVKTILSKISEQLDRWGKNSKVTEDSSYNPENYKLRF